jgi:hypothetical protein
MPFGFSSGRRFYREGAEHAAFIQLIGRDIKRSCLFFGISSASNVFSRRELS